jgi:hypothetical protein
MLNGGHENVDAIAAEANGTSRSVRQVSDWLDHAETQG